MGHAAVRAVLERVEGDVTISATERLTSDHVVKHAPLRVADVRAQDAAQIPDGYEPLGHRALAARLRCSPRTARRRLETFAARAEHDPEQLRVIELPVPIGSGAVRLAKHVLWPCPQVPEAAGSSPAAPPVEHALSA